jgi:hypothetical protein
MREDFRKGSPPPETSPLNECLVFQEDATADRLAELGLTEEVLLQSVTIA